MKCVTPSRRTGHKASALMHSRSKKVRSVAASSLSARKNAYRKSGRDCKR